MTAKQAAPEGGLFFHGSFEPDLGWLAGELANQYPEHSDKIQAVVTDPECQRRLKGELEEIAKREGVDGFLTHASHYADNPPPTPAPTPNRPIINWFKQNLPTILSAILSIFANSPKGQAAEQAKSTGDDKGKAAEKK